MRNAAIPVTAFFANKKGLPLVLHPRGMSVATLLIRLSYGRLFISSNHVRLKNGHDWANSINCADARLNLDKAGKTLARLAFEGY